MSSHLTCPPHPDIFGAYSQDEHLENNKENEAKPNKGLSLMDEWKLRIEPKLIKRLGFFL